MCAVSPRTTACATALDAQADEYDTTVLAELTAAVHPENMDAVREELINAGLSWQV